MKLFYTYQYIPVSTIHQLPKPNCSTKIQYFLCTLRFSLLLPDFQPKIRDRKIYYTYENTSSWNYILPINIYQYQQTINNQNRTIRISCTS